MLPIAHDCLKVYRLEEVAISPSEQTKHVVSMVICITIPMDYNLKSKVNHAVMGCAALPQQLEDVLLVVTVTSCVPVDGFLPKGPFRKAVVNTMVKDTIVPSLLMHVETMVINLSQKEVVVQPRVREIWVVANMLQIVIFVRIGIYEIESEEELQIGLPHVLVLDVGVIVYLYLVSGFHMPTGVGTTNGVREIVLERRTVPEEDSYSN